jgi:hypothetical protein
VLHHKASTQVSVDLVVDFLVHLQMLRRIKLMKNLTITNKFIFSSTVLHHSHSTLEVHSVEASQDLPQTHKPAAKALTK